jgi:predicted alpha/beta hydrolase family esterase
MMKKKVIALHGGNIFSNYDAYVTDLRTKEIDVERLRPSIDWKQNMPEALGDGYDFYLPRMPMSDNADYVLWKMWFERIMCVIQEPCIFIGHSLGAMFLVKYFIENETRYTAQALLLVAPEYQHFEDKSVEKSSFTVEGDLSVLTERVPKVIFFHSKDDPVVLYDNFEKFKKAVPSADFRSFSDRKHFWGASFPEIVDILKHI